MKSSKLILGERMKPSGIVLVLLLVVSSFSFIVPSVYPTSSPIILDGTMNPDEQWTFWHSDSTYDFVGYCHFEQETNKLAYEAHVCTTDPDSLCVFISTNDNSFDSNHRDKFSVYFDVYPYGRGEEDKAYEIEVPSFWYGAGIKKHGPHWWSLDNYQNIVAGSANGYRTYELHLPLSDIVPDTEDENYRHPRFMICIENYGSVKWRAQKLNNYHPDEAEHKKWGKHADLWEELDLKSWYPTFWGGTQQEFTLTSNIQGSGLVSTNVTGPYSSGETVEVTATPEAGWTFSHWEGDLTGTTNPEVLTITENTTIVAYFVQNNYTLTVETLGDGSVTLSPLSSTYTYGEQVELTAIPAIGWSFSEWNGDVLVFNEVISVTVDTNKSVVAVFIPNEHSIVVNFVGQGSVSKNPDQIIYNYSDIVELVALPEQGYIFSEWTGDLSGSSNPAAITMDENKNVTAIFVEEAGNTTAVLSLQPGLEGPPPALGEEFCLTLHVEKVTDLWAWNVGLEWNPDVLEMIQATEGDFLKNGGTYTTVFLPVMPNNTLGCLDEMAGTIFADGDVSGSGDLATITFRVIGYGTSSIEITQGELVKFLQPYEYEQIEHYVYNSEFKLLESSYGPTTLSVDIIGEGTVTKNPDKSVYDFGEEVSLTVAPASGWVFSQWAGDLSSSYQNPVTLTMNGNKSVTAIFVEDTGIPTPVLSVQPGLVQGPPPELGQEFNITVHVENVTDLWGWTVDLKWNPEVLEMITAPTEGSFIKDAGYVTIFMPVPANNTAGFLDGLSSIIAGYGGVSGSGDLATVIFTVIGYGQTDIEIVASRIAQDGEPFNHIDVTHLVLNSKFELPPPLSCGPTADFMPADDAWYYEGDLVTLECSSSVPGFDTLPSSEICPITSYLWEIDFGNDGTIDTTLTGENASFVGTYLGDTAITLTVTAPDLTSPSEPNYQEIDSVTHVIHVTERPTMANLDVYTDRGGQCANVSSDAYGPQELVTIYGYLTYNDVPVVAKDVIFEIRDNNGNFVAYRNARTDENGLATVDFRLPWLDDDNPQALFGNWTIIGSVDISQVTATDICTFDFNYIVQIVDAVLIDVANNPVSIIQRDQVLRVNLTISNIRAVAVTPTITMTVHDECNVLIGYALISVSVPARSDLSVILDVTIPSWAFVGQATAYFGAYGDESLQGAPYSPEVQHAFLIEQ